MKDRIKKIRKEFDLTQREFADKIGIKQNTVATYEIGKIEPSNSIISLICHEFNVSETWLRTGEGDMFIPENRDNQLAMWMGQVLADEDDSFKKRLLNVLRGFTEEQWSMIEEKAKELFVEEGNGKIGGAD